MGPARRHRAAHPGRHAGQLLPPSYWLKELGDRVVPGTVLLSGTIPMIPGVDQFADAWRVELTDPRGPTSRVVYTVEQLAPAWDYMKEQKEFFTATHVARGPMEDGGITNEC